MGTTNLGCVDFPFASDGEGIVAAYREAYAKQWTPAIKSFV
jgi:hypothetical protein